MIQQQQQQSQWVLTSVQFNLVSLLLVVQSMMSLQGCCCLGFLNLSLVLFLKIRLLLLLIGLQVLVNILASDPDLIFGAGVGNHPYNSRVSSVHVIHNSFFQWHRKHSDALHFPTLFLILLLVLMASLSTMLYSLLSFELGEEVGDHPNMVWIVNVHVLHHLLFLCLQKNLDPKQF